MPEISEALRERFEGVTTLCHCWQLATADGTQTIRVTEHDRSVVWQGETYLPGLTARMSSLRHTLSMAPEPLDIEGALEADGITEGDLKAGVWDGARVTIWRVDWQAPEYGIWLWSGYLTGIDAQGLSFLVRLASVKSDLEKTIGRVFGRRCDAELGDARCSVALETAPQSTCDKHFTTCRDVFSNALNFRGFPFMPGNDVLVAGPGDVRDGSGRGIIR